MHRIHSQRGDASLKVLGLLALAVLAAVIFLAVGSRHRAEAAREAAAAAAARPSGAGAAVLDAALQTSDADVGMLKDLSGRLERACARNKYGLSEQECLTRLHTRQDLCANQTAQRFPGRLHDTGRVEVVMQAYVGCIFEG